MKVSNLRALLSELDDNADVTIVSVNNNVLTVDDIAPIIVCSNVDAGCYYIYTQDANSLCEEA